MHTHHATRGTVFHFNSDLSGPIEIVDAKLRDVELSATLAVGQAQTSLEDLAEFLTRAALDHHGAMEAMQAALLPRVAAPTATDVFAAFLLNASDPESCLRAMQELQSMLVREFHTLRAEHPEAVRAVMAQLQESEAMPAAPAVAPVAAVVETESDCLCGVCTEHRYTYSDKCKCSVCVGHRASIAGIDAAIAAAAGARP